MMRPAGEGGAGLFAAGYDHFFPYGLTAILTMTAGTVFLMWLGEQIDEYGIGNGISLIIMAGIVARIPDATMNLLWDFKLKVVPFIPGWFKPSLFTLGGTSSGDIGLEKLVVLILLFIGVVVAVIAITKGQRRIPTQSAKHVRGRRVYGGTRQYLPLKVNQAGVMPVIFASSLLLIPMFLFRWMAQQFQWGWAWWLQNAFERQGYTYNIFYI